MTIVLGLAYLAGLLLIGVFAVRGRQGASDYFLAGKSLGLVVAAFTTMASIMSGFVFVGGPGLFYQVGFGSVWIILSSSFTGALMCWIIAGPLHRLARDDRVLTLIDALRLRFPCRWTAGAVALGMMVGVVGYLATQLKALVIVLESAFPVSGVVAVGLGLAGLIFYSVLGGTLASVYTDVIQGVVMLWAASIGFYFAAQAIFGLPDPTATLLRTEPGWAGPWGTVGPVMALGWFFLFALGSMGQPHVVNRFMMLKDLGSLRFFPILVAVGMLACGLIWVGAGLAVRLWVEEGRIPPLDHPDLALSSFLDVIAPAWFRPVAYLGILAAIMSTVDSFVGVGSAILARDLPRIWGSPPRHQVFWGRVAGLALFVTAGVAAVLTESLVASIGIASFGLFAACLVPLLVAGLNWSAAGVWAARAGVATGLTSALVFEWGSRTGVFNLGVPPGLPALAIALAAFMIGGLLEKERRLRG